MNYHNKKILITGAYRGIGKSLCNYFAQQKAYLIITYHEHEKETFLLKEELQKKYHNVVDIYYLDLSNEESIYDLMKKIKDKNDYIDIMINNAAISLDNHINDKTKNEFMKVLEINVVGTFLMMKYFDNIINQGYIFNISSTDGINTGNIYSIDYNASKAAINNMTSTFSLYSKNKIISICPNWVDTESTKEMLPEYLQRELNRINQKKLINPLEVAQIIDKCINDNVKSGSVIRIEG